MTGEEKLILMKVFKEDPMEVVTYLNLIDDQLRHEWIQQMLNTALHS